MCIPLPISNPADCVTRGTIEEKIDALIAEKQQMSNEILEGDGGTALTEMSNEQILEMVTLDLDRATE